MEPIVLQLIYYVIFAEPYSQVFLIKVEKFSTNYVEK
jgi:hypothetical protein